MKKNIICVLALAIIFSALTFAQKKKSTVQVLTPDLENISAADMWLKGQVQDKLKENLQDYAKFITVVDDSNERQLKNLQRKSESSAYDEETAIEAGHLTSAASAIFTTIRKAGVVYTIGLNYMDLRTGIHETVTSTGRKNTKDLFDSAGCAVDELTLKLCEKLKISLTGTEKYILQHGSADLTVEQQVTIIKQDTENYKSQLADLDKQISLLSVSTNLEAEGLKKKIAAEKSLIEEKQASAERRLEELNEQNRKKLEDAQKEAERSLEMRNKRDDIERQAEKKAAEVRNLKLEKETVLGKISVIESKKRALVEIRSSVKDRVKEINNQAQKDIAAKTDEINSETYSRIEMKDGMPTADAVTRRKNKIATETKKIEAAAKENIENAKASTKKNENALYKEIHKDYSKIQARQTVSSLGEELKVNYGIYDGEKKAWPVTLYLYCDKILLTEERFYLSYSIVSGKTAPDLKSASDEKIQDYGSVVDMYDSLLSRGSQIIRFEMDYHVEPEADKKTSTYRFFFDELRVYDTIKNRVIFTPEISSKVRERTMTPVYDIRTDKVALMDTKKQNAYNKKVKLFKQSAGGGGMTGLNVSAGVAQDSQAVFDINLAISVSPYIFGYIGGGMNKKVDDSEKISDSYGMGYFDLGVGFNWRPFILVYPPAFYIRSGIGLSFIKLDDCHYLSSNSGDSSGDSIHDFASYILWHTAAGVQLPLSEKIAVFGEGHLNYLIDAEFNYSVSVGLSRVLF